MGTHRASGPSLYQSWTPPWRPPINSNTTEAKRTKDVRGLARNASRISSIICRRYSTFEKVMLFDRGNADRIGLRTVGNRAFYLMSFLVVLVCTFAAQIRTTRNFSILGLEVTNSTELPRPSPCVRALYRERRRQKETCVGFECWIQTSLNYGSRFTNYWFFNLFFRSVIPFRPRQRTLPAVCCL